MEQIINNIFFILLLNGSILLMPGVNFLLVARHSLLNGISSGLYCAMGITLAIMSHVVLSTLNASFLLKKYPFFVEVVKYSGALYLIYLGTNFIISAFKEPCSSSQSSHLSVQKTAAFKSGFLVDILNPFISIFYLSLSSTIIGIDVSFFELSIYGLVIFLITIFWFSVVAIFFAHKHLHKYFYEKNKYIQMLSGLAIYYFSIKIIFSF